MHGFAGMHHVGPVSMHALAGLAGWPDLKDLEIKI